MGAICACENYDDDEQTFDGVKKKDQPPPEETNEDNPFSLDGWYDEKKGDQPTKGSLRDLRQGERGTDARRHHKKRRDKR